MARTGALAVGLAAVVIGGALGVMGVFLALASGSFLSGDAQHHDGFFGLGGGDSQSASVPTAPWIGLLLALAGVAIFSFGLRGMMEASD